MKKSIKTLLLTLILLLSINNSVFAETIYTEGALNYVIRDGSIIVVNYFGSSPKVVVPDTIGGYVVTGIAKNALTSEAIEEVVLPETITEIAEGAIITHDHSSKKEDDTPKVVVVDSYNNVIKESIEEMTVDEDYFLSSEEYDEYQELVENKENTSNVFEEEIEDDKQEEDEVFEEIYSVKVSETKKTNYTPYVIVGVVIIIVGIVFIVYKRKNRK